MANLEKIAQETVDAIEHAAYASDHYSFILDALRGAAAVPDGWQLVPKKPTTVQVNSGFDAGDGRTGFEAVKHIYRTMVTDAPPAPEKAGGE